MVFVLLRGDHIEQMVLEDWESAFRTEIKSSSVLFSDQKDWMITSPPPTYLAHPQHKFKAFTYLLFSLALSDKNPQNRS